MSAIFAIGDIHGQKARLEDALGWIEADEAAGAPVVFVGDYVDRGPDSRGVIDMLIQGQSDGRGWTCLMGNHDRFLLRYLENPDYRDPQTHRPLVYTDKPLGGGETLRSYGVTINNMRTSSDIHADAIRAVPQEHRDWIAGLPRLHETPQQIFVHAGIRPGVPLDEQVEDDLIWIREPFLSDPSDHGRLVVHGHTAIASPQLYDNRLNTDGGGGYGRTIYPVLLLGGEAFLIGPFGRARL